MPNGHCIPEDAYVAYTLNALKKMVRQTEYWRGWVPPRSWTQPEPSRSEVMAALDEAIELVLHHLEHTADER